jgi:hypothetical protein
VLKNKKTAPNGAILFFVGEDSFGEVGVLFITIHKLVYFSMAIRAKQTTVFVRIKTASISWYKVMPLDAFANVFSA